jgi:hypothetical protein
LDKAVRYLIYNGEINQSAYQKDIAAKMGASNTVNISYALNGNEKYLTDNFVKRFCNTFDGKFSLDWMLTGKGEMLIDEKKDGIAATTEAPTGEAWYRSLIDTLTAAVTEERRKNDALAAALNEERETRNKILDTLHNVTLELERYKNAYDKKGFAEAK